MRSGANITRVDARGVGNQRVLDDCFLDALDVWGYVEQGVEVCFPQSGRLVMLDAATSPRSLMSIGHYWKDGRTCAYTDRAGTVVLLCSQSPPPSLTPTPPQAQSLQGCMVETTHILNLRESPGGPVFSIVPYQVKLTAFARTADWFYVDYHGARGWLSAGYIIPYGACG